MRTPAGAFIHRPFAENPLVGMGFVDDEAPDLGVAGPPVGAAADILNRGNFPARRAGDNMPHIAGHERQAIDPGLVNRSPDAAVRVLPGQQPLGNANLPNVAAAQDAAGLPPIVPDAPPGGGRGERFPWLERLVGIDDLRIGEVPMAELELNLAQRYGEGGSIDRRLEGLDAIQVVANQVGNTEGEIAAREVALQRLRGGGLGAGALRGQLAASQESALRQQAEQFAQRGLGGGVPAVAMMQAQRMGAIGAAGTEAAFRENLQRSALQDINAMNQELGNRRLAAADLLQNYLGQWELPPIDLAGLAIKPEDAQLPVGDILPGQAAGGAAGEDGAPPLAGGGFGVPVGRAEAPGGGDPNDPRTWHADENGMHVPEGHPYAGCTLSSTGVAHGMGGVSYHWNCPEGVGPEGGGRSRAGNEVAAAFGGAAAAFGG